MDDYQDYDYLEVPMGRIGRRKSLSVGTGMDLLVTLKDNYWDTDISGMDGEGELPPLSEEDEETPLNNKEGKKAKFVHSRTPSNGADISDMSELDSPIIPTKLPKKYRRVGMLGVKPPPNSDANGGNHQSLASRRKSGIVPINIPNSNFDHSDPNEGESGNLVNRLTSRLSGKLQTAKKSLPFLFKKRKQTEYKLQAFVIILLLTIVVLVGGIYVTHKGKLLKLTYFDHIRFSSQDQKLLITNQNNKEVISGKLGMSLTPKDKAWPCLQQHEMENSICLEWIDKARLYFHPVPQTSKEILCYQVFWQTINPSFQLKDCFYFSEPRNNFFYGGGETFQNQWTFNQTVIPFSPFLTGKNVPTSLPKENTTHLNHSINFEWGRTLQNFFINSLGSSITIDNQIRLHVSINHPTNNTLCIGAKNSYGYLPISHHTLNYTICTGPDIKTLAKRHARETVKVDTPREQYEASKQQIQIPIWRVAQQNHQNQTPQSLLEHSESIAALSDRSTEGFFLLDEHWQKHIGDLDVDSERFPNMTETFDIISRRGLKLGLTIHPFVSTQSKNYVKGLTYDNGNMIWLSERGPNSNNNNNENLVPALTYYKDWPSVAMLDVTNPKAVAWLTNEVQAVVNKYSISALYIDIGSAYEFPAHYQFSRPLVSADEYKQLFLNAITKVKNISTTWISGAVKRPQLPTFVALSPTPSTWEGLASVIPNILTLGVSGYPFILPGSIGGDFGPRPDKELYIRWLQLAHFLPVVQFSILPSEYDDEVVRIAADMASKRKVTLLNHLEVALKEAKSKGLPMIRPLWMVDSDTDSFKYSNEFMIGDSVLVAPIIEPGKHYQEVHLPEGIWRNEIDGIVTKGSKKDNVRVGISSILYYTRVTQRES